MSEKLRIKNDEGIKKQIYSLSELADDEDLTEEQID